MRTYLGCLMFLEYGDGLGLDWRDGNNVATYFGEIGSWCQLVTAHEVPSLDAAHLLR